MQIDIVAQASRRDHRVIFVLGGQPHERIVRLSIDDGTLLDPANFVLLGLDFQKATTMFQNFELLTVGHLSHSIGYGSHAILQIHLSRCNVNHLVLLVAETPASTGKHGDYENE